MNKKILHIAVIIALLSLAACTGGEAEVITVQERIIPVNTAVVSIGNISTELSFAGQVRAEDHIAIMSRLPGMVDQVMADVGDFINAGDILFTMDAVDLENNINSLTAQLATADAAVNAARTGVAHAEGSAMQQQILQATGGIAQAETALAQAEVQVEQASLSLNQATLGLEQAQNALDTAQQSYLDTSSLFAAGVATRMQMDQAEMAYSNAQIAHSNAQIALEQARNGYNVANVALNQAQTSHRQAIQSHQLIAEEMPEENRQRAEDALAQAIAQRDSLVVNLNAARERLEDAAVRSPISGVIGSRNVEPQTMLSQAAAPFTVVSADTVLVAVEVTETIINRINVGQQVAVNISAASTNQFIGEVTVVAPAANQVTSTFTIEVSVDNRDGLIRPGMFAEVFFTRESAENVIVVPRSAVLNEDGEHVVYLAQGDMALRRPVVTGIDTGTEIEVVSGLTAGDSLIVTGQTFVTDGVQILVVESGVSS